LQFLEPGPGEDRHLDLRRLEADVRLVELLEGFRLNRLQVTVMPEDLRVTDGSGEVREIVDVCAEDRLKEPLQLGPLQRAVVGGASDRDLSALFGHAWTVAVGRLFRAPGAPTPPIGMTSLPGMATEL